MLSEQSLQADVEDVLKQYRRGLGSKPQPAFRGDQAAPARSATRRSCWTRKGGKHYVWTSTSGARQLNATTPRDSVVTGLAALAGGWIGTEAAEAVVAQILARVGTAIAVEAAETAAATGGSAMVGGTATGGGIGSLGGPAGTVIGVGVGLAVGAAIDWWLSDRLEDHVSEQCHRFLDTVEHQHRRGKPAVPGTAGIVRAGPQTCGPAPAAKPSSMLLWRPANEVSPRVGGVRRLGRNPRLFSTQPVRLSRPRRPWLGNW